MATSPLGEREVPITDLQNELNILLKDYESIHDAPRCINETLTDLKYLSDTLTYLESLLGDSKHKLHMQEPSVENLKGLKPVLRKELKDLHSVLRKWPNPPTLSATVTFGALHSHKIKDIRRRVIRHQLEFTVILSKTTFLPEEDEFAIALRTLLSKPEVSTVEVRPHQEPYSLFTVTKTEDRDDEMGNPPPTTELVDVLLKLPKTMRLSRLVQTLQQIHEITTSPFVPSFATFRSDVAGILDLAKELDKRLLGENHFSQDVKVELHAAIDLAIKFLLHELVLLGKLLEESSLHPALFRKLENTSYSKLPIHKFLQEQRVIFMMLLALVAGCRFTAEDPRHEGGSLKDEQFEDAVAAALEAMAKHSSKVNCWREGRRAGVQEANGTEAVDTA